ncbi:hypothetical protein D3C83_92850 [compost metagenome]
MADGHISQSRGFIFDDEDAPVLFVPDQGGGGKLHHSFIFPGGDARLERVRSTLDSGEYVGEAVFRVIGSLRRDQ